MARLPLLGIEGLRARLNQRFSVLTGGSRAVLRRHQTLRAALDWSHGLLSVDEQAVFRRLGVFAGGFTLEGAQRVAEGDGIDEWDVLEHLGALVDKSLVMAEGDPIPRYRLLETARLFALEQFGVANETDATLRRHAQAMVSFIEDFERVVHDRAASPAEESQLGREVDNVRAALEWLNQAPREASEINFLAIHLGGLAGRVLEQGGAQEAFDRTLALRLRIDASTPPHLTARYWSMLAETGVITAREESYDAAIRGARLYEQLNDDARRFRCPVALIAIGARRGLGWVRRTRPANCHSTGASYGVQPVGLLLRSSGGGMGMAGIGTACCLCPLPDDKRAERARGICARTEISAPLPRPQSAWRNAEP